MIYLLFLVAVASWFASREWYDWRARVRLSRAVRGYQADVAEEVRTREALREANLAIGGERRGVVYQFAPRKRRGEGSPAA